MFRHLLDGHRKRWENNKTLQLVLDTCIFRDNNGRVDKGEIKGSSYGGHDEGGNRGMESNWTNIK